MSNIVYRPFLEKLGGSQASNYVGKEGDLFYDPSTTTLRVSDGTTPGGVLVSTGGGGNPFDQDLNTTNDVTFNTVSLTNGAVIKDNASDSISFGGGAGASSQGGGAVAIGEGAGNNTQGNQAVAVGRGSGNYQQGVGAVGIGFCAGATEQGDYSVAIGFKAARGNMDNDGTPNQPANSIMINASNTPLNGNQAGLYINPVREDTGNIAKSVYYNTTTKELTYADPTGGGGAGLPLANGTSNFDIATENGNTTITTNGTYTWTFDTDGLLQVPDYTGNNIAGVIGDNYGNGGLTIKANASPTGYVEITNGGETAGVYVENGATGQVRIFTNDQQWDFNPDGSASFGSVSLGNGSLTGVKGIDQRAGFASVTAGVMTISNNNRIVYAGNPTGNEITANFTVNLTDFVLDVEYETTAKIRVRQHNTGYYPNVLQINGVTQTIKWEGGTPPTPTNTLDAIDMFEFNIVNLNSGGGIYLVLGRMRSFN